jgi:ribosomal protein S12 methylthiotransferase accessory factor
LPLDVALTQVSMQRLTDGSEVLVPAGFVCLDFRPEPPEPPVTLPISTGLAFHPTLHDAIWRGQCEVIERDAVMSFWWIHAGAREIDLEGAPLSVRNRLTRLESRGMSARLFDITTELAIPTVFCVLRADHYPRVVVSAATRASAAAACAKALDEVVSMRVALRPQQAIPPQDVKPRTLVDHARWYASGERDQAFEFVMAADPDRTPFEEFAARSIIPPHDMASLKAIAKGLEQSDISILWVEVTAPDVGELGTVVRVVVPELVPLSGVDDVRWLATRRLLGRAGAEIATRSLFTSHPHPFA